MKIAFISAEVYPYAKTGGLGDVAGSLPKALANAGCEIKIFVPKYNSMDEEVFGLRYCWDIGEMPVRVNGHIRSVHLHQAKLPGSDVEVNFIDCPHYFHRGKIYTNDKDEDERFILFSKGVIEALQRLKWDPDIIHCNDWQTGLLPLLVKDNYNWDRMFDKTAFLYTIHNIGYQGRFHKSTLTAAELKPELFYPGGPIELEGSFCFMKPGILFSEIISTVSPTYAKEILTPQYGAGMEATLQSREPDLYGIINGIDISVWDPSTDRHIPFNYDINSLEEKKKNKQFLMNHFNLAYREDVPLIGIISRFVAQKGLNLFAEAAQGLMHLNAQWIILGSGEEQFEDFFSALSRLFPNKAGVYIGYNSELSHLIEAGSDMFLMPSHYEPCGLNQLYSLRYGTVPVVRKTGGLADTVQDWHEYLANGHETGTGFSFNDTSPYALFTTVQRAIETYKDEDTWRKIQRNGMIKDYSWETSAKDYISVYHKAMQKRNV